MVLFVFTATRNAVASIRESAAVVDCRYYTECDLTTGRLFLRYTILLLYMTMIKTVSSFILYRKPSPQFACWNERRCENDDFFFTVINSVHGSDVQTYTEYTGNDK
jgi:hypothetical protein